MIRRLMIGTWLLLAAMPTQAEPVYLTSLSQVKTGYYRLYSHAYDGLMALSESADGSTNVFCDKPNAADYMQVWWIQVISSTDTMLFVELQNAVSQRWISRRRDCFYTCPASMVFHMKLTADGFIIYNGGGLFHQEKGHDVVSWSTDPAASKWQIEAVEIDKEELKGQRTEYVGDMTGINRRPAIIFNTNGGTEVPVIAQDYGTPVTAPADPTRKGYIFMGWSREIPATMPADSLTIWAEWQEIEPEPEPEPELGIEPENELVYRVINRIE